MNQISYHEANRLRWEVASKRWAAMHDQRGTWKICHQDPALVFSTSELRYLGDLTGKKAAVLGSGDNLACFAMAGMGADVTSVDISESQLAVASQRAEELNLSITFVQADVCNISTLRDQAFDVVYTGGHVAVWVSDLNTYYLEATRILKPQGLFIVNEYHPFRRIWKQGIDRLQVEYDYYNRGPFKYLSNENIMGANREAFETYEFHWSVGDLINAVLNAGCQIIHAEEFGDHVGDWEGAPMQGLPEYFFLVGRKV